MNMNMKLRDVMTRGVERIASDDTVQRAAEIMAAKDIGFIAVTDGEGHGRGVLTDRDIVLRCLAQQKDPATTTIAECMSQHISALSEDADVREACELMEKQQIRRVVVVDSQKRCTGVVSLGDLARCLDDHDLCAEVLERVSEPGKSSLGQSRPTM